MKVLHLLDSVNRGGAETQVLDVCRNAARFGIDITLVAAAGGNLEEDFRNSGAEYIRLNRTLPIDARLVSQLRSIIKQRNINIVHGYQAVDALHLYLATRGLQNLRTVLSFQGFIPGKKNRLMARMLAPRMDANISVSNSLFIYLKDEVGISRGDNFHVIYNGADPERLKPSGKSIKTELGLPNDATLGAMVANFTADPTKDQITICRALPGVLKQFPDFHFVFAGRVAAGAEARMAECVNVCEENGITDRVHFLGARSDIADILAELDVFVFSSRREGFPVAVSEAMLAGVPLIVSDIESLREAVRGGDLGQMFPVGDADELTESMVQLLSNQVGRARMTGEAQQYARDNFSIDAHMRGLKELYEGFTKGKS